MSMPPDFVNPIPRDQWARFVRDSETGQPIIKLIRDLENQQNFVLGDIPTAILAAQATADAAQASAGVANGKLNGASFITLNDDSAALPQSRRLQATGPGLKLVDGGAGVGVTLSLAQTIAILPADVTDATGAFINAPGLSAALELNSTYMVEALLTLQSASAVVGVGLCFTLPGAASINGNYSHNTAALATQTAYNNAAGSVSADTTAAAAVATNIPIVGRWIIATGGTAGIAQLQMRSSSAGTAVKLKAALSCLVFRKIG